MHVFYHVTPIAMDRRCHVAKDTCGYPSDRYLSDIVLGS